MYLSSRLSAVLLLTTLMGWGSTDLGAQNAGQVIDIHAKRFAFSPAAITLRKGEPATLALTSDDAPHSLLIEGLGVNAPIAKGKTTRIAITPKTAGDFKGRCGCFCGSGHGSMTFTVHVVE